MERKKKQKHISPEFDFFLHARLERYEGKYVAILGKKIVGSGLSAKEVWEKARKKYPESTPTIAKIPKQEVLILLWK
ncbi:succinyl-CoA synthetase subunit alpha [Candidatus Roizmanbacteria bacterium]|nr:succinyl-CoA synthetase subunit alpha [Candidatus Roizmanbacteria bacterium]